MPENTKLVKIILSGKVTKAYVVKDKVHHRDQGRQERGRIGRRPFRGLRDSRGHIQHQRRRRSRRHDALRRDAQASVVPAGRARGLSDRHVHSGAGHRCGAIRRVLLDSERHAARHVQHVLGRRAAALQHLRAERDALHHRVDHRADGLDGVSAVESDPQGRRVRPAQADAVHALRHGGAGRIPRLRRGAGHSEFGRQSGAESRARSSCSSPPYRSPPAPCS